MFADERDEMLFEAEYYKQKTQELQQTLDVLWRHNSVMKVALDTFMRDNSIMKVALQKIAKYDCTGNTIGAFFECKNTAQTALNEIEGA